MPHNKFDHVANLLPLSPILLLLILGKLVCGRWGGGGGGWCCYPRLCTILAIPTRTATPWFDPRPLCKFLHVCNVPLGMMLSFSGCVDPPLITRPTMTIFLLHYHPSSSLFLTLNNISPYSFSLSLSLFISWYLSFCLSPNSCITSRISLLSTCHSLI